MRRLLLPLNYVAPLVGAWIEMVVERTFLLEEKVAPLVGAWIEIFPLASTDSITESLPLWERGLK